MIAAIFEVFLFELRRSLTPARIVIWCVLALFPAVLLGTINFQSAREIPVDVTSILVFALIPMVSCLLGLLLWVTPAIQSELEGNTWIYIAARPMGPHALLYGKYITAIIWTASATLVAGVGAVLASGMPDPLHLIRVTWTLTILSCVCYGAVYLLIGVVVLRRTMVLAFAYTLIVEGVVSTVPATINKLTIQYRLRSLLGQWMEVDKLKGPSELLFGTESAAQHLLLLACYAAIALIAAGVILRFREIPMQIET